MQALADRESVPMTLIRPLIKMILELLLVFFSFLLVGQVLEHYGMTSSTANQVTTLMMIVIFPFIISSFVVTAKKRPSNKGKAMTCSVVPHPINPQCSMMSR